MPSPWTEAAPQARPVALLDGPLGAVLTPGDAETVRDLLRAEHDEEYDPNARYGQWWGRHDESEER